MSESGVTRSNLQLAQEGLRTYDLFRLYLLLPQDGYDLSQRGPEQENAGYAQRQREDGNTYHTGVHVE